MGISLEAPSGPRDSFLETLGENRLKDNFDDLHGPSRGPYHKQS